MTAIAEHIADIRQHIPEGVTLVCVSKYHPCESIEVAYAAGERDFGESRVQEMCQKAQILPKDIRWHMIGHLQTNKVRQIIPFIHLIHSVDSIRLLDTINHEAERIGRHVRVLIEVHVAREESKSGFLPEEIPSDFSAWPWITVCGYMTMASHTDDPTEWRRCFRAVASLPSMPGRILSMGMSDDYLVAIEEGSNMIRIGSNIFGERQY